jgi:hypothetical protein
VNDLVSLAAEGLYGAHRDAHVRQEPHARDPAVG